MATTSAADVRGLLVDAAAIVGIAVLLVAIHVLVPPGVRNDLAFRYAAPDPFHALTAAYVHLTDAHLRGNVAGLLASGAWAILVSHLAGERRWFRFSLLWFLTALPVATGLTGAVLVGGALTVRGFSAVVAGLAGFGLVGIGVVLHRVYKLDRSTAGVVVAAVSVAIAAEILWLVTGGVSPRVRGLLLAGFGLTLVPIVQTALEAGLPADRQAWIRLAGAVLMTVLFALLVAAFVVALFPRELVADGSVTNIFGHYLGLVYGTIIAGWGYRYWSVPEARGSEEPPELSAPAGNSGTEGA